jgi:alpha-1,3-rhamnosyl/mannosyltransferase
MRRTGNETWTRNMVIGLMRHASAGELEIVISPAGEGDLAAMGLVASHHVSDRSSRRLLIDLPRVIRRARASAVLCQYTAPLSRVPTVLAIHDLSFEDPRSSEWLPRLSRARMRLSVGVSCRRAASILVLSEWGRQDLLRWHDVAPDRVRVVSAAVDPDLQRLLSSASTHERGQARFRVLAVGNVLPRKNLGVLAAAVSRLVAEGIDAELRIVGQVPATGATVAKQMSDLLGERLTMTGYVSMNELADEYARADILAFPSLYEGFGIPIVEAMTAGLPVVASTATCLPEIVDHAGLLAEPDDVDTWTAHLANLASDPALRENFAALGQARVADFSWDLSAVTALRALRDAGEQSA